MTYLVEMLPAGHGDAIVVEYGTGDLRYHLLVDAGPASAWASVRARLIERADPRYELFVVTHIDEDHLGGAIELLDDWELRARIPSIWFNGYVHCARGGSVLGPVQGEQLTSRIANGPYLWNAELPDPVSPGVGGPVVVPAEGDPPVIDLPGGARLVLISPSPVRLSRIAHRWKEAVEAAGLVPGGGAAGFNRAPPPTAKAVPPIPERLSRAELEHLAAGSASDGSAANGSSIAFVLEFDGRRLLLTGDAHAGELVAGLKRYARMVGERRPRIDVAKLAHHGSRANTSMSLIDAIDCRRYLISSNGDLYGHPDDSAIARVILGSPGPTSFSCNYDTPRTRPWVVRGEAFGATFEVPRMVTSV